AEDGIRDRNVTGVQTCALPISFMLVSKRPVGQMLYSVSDRRIIFEEEPTITRKNHMKESAVTVIGGGTMGREIAFVAAMSGFSTYLVDVESRFLDNAREQLVKSTDRMVERQRVSQEAVDAGFENLEFTTDRDTAVKNSSFVVE